ncbi:MAG: hypothetical protein RIC87_14115 [Kiloniellales bacterium]
MTIDKPASSIQQWSLWLCAAFGAFLLAGSPAAAQTTAKVLDTACSLPQGQTAEAIVGRVEKRLNGDWNLATKTLRQTIARQQRLGQDSKPAEAYLKTLTCLQREVESGQHNAYLEANGGKARLAGSSQSLVSQSAPSQPYVAPLPSAGEQPAATGAPAELSSLTANNAARPAPQASTPAPQASTPAPQASTPAPQVVIPAPQQQAQVQQPQPQQTVQRQVPQAKDGLVLPGTPESYALLGGGQAAGRSTVPAIRPLDGGAPVLQSGTPITSLDRQARLVVPPRAPKERGSSLQQLASRATPAPVSPPAAPPIAPAVTAPAVQPSVQAAAPAQNASPAPATQSAAVSQSSGDPRYINKACLYFTRPELEVIRGRVYTNRYPTGARVCHKGDMYICDGGLWSSQGLCSAHADAQALDSSVLEAKPRR